ncbi:MAG: hypothetical protein NVSMB66_6280 [Candidatus Doudnabacteria bacterium]
MADFTANLNTSTSALPKLFAKTIDVATNFSPMTSYLLRNQKKWTGTQQQQSIKQANQTNGISFDGLDKFNTNQTNNIINLTFNPTAREMPVVISQIEADINSTQPVIGLEKRTMKGAAQDLVQNVATDFFTQQTGKNFLSLIDGADDGSNVGTYGGQSRTTYTNLKGSVTSSVGALSTARMRTLYNAISHGSRTPNLIVTHKTVWGYYEALLTATVQTTLVQSDLTGYSQFMSDGAITAMGQGTTGQQGFNAVRWSGIPVVADENCPAGYMFFLNKESWGFYGVKSDDKDMMGVDFGSSEIDGVYSNAPKFTGFYFTGFRKPIDQYAKVGHMILIGNLICNESRINGYLSGITS